MRLIDADALIMALRLEYPMIPMFKENQKEWGIKTEGYRKAEEVIKDAPTIEPKRGEWIEVSFNEKIKYMVCSECGNKYAVDLIVPLEAWIDEKHKFCGLCGADMREREGE